MQCVLVKGFADAAHPDGRGALHGSDGPASALRPALAVATRRVDHRRPAEAHLTKAAEHLYGRVIETVRKDLREELAFVAVYESAYRALTERFDGLPASRISLLALLCLQNGGRLARGKRRLFLKLTDEEIAAAEGLIQAAMGLTDDR